MAADVAPGGLQLQPPENEKQSGQEGPRPISAPASCQSFEVLATCEPAVATAGGRGGIGHARPQVKCANFTVSRWVVFVLYCGYCLLAGPAFMNWTTIADMLYKGDAYIWECKSGAVANPPPKPHEAKCPEQELAVNHLFNVASSSYFVFAMLGGIALDYAGPKLGALSGLACLVLGWLLLAFSNEGFRAYVPAMVFAGAGIDMAFFPCLCGANLFPGYVATVIAMYGAFRSISFVVGLALRGLFFNIAGFTLRTTLLGFVGVGLGYCVCVALLVIPWTAWPPPPEPEGDGSGEAAGEAAEEKEALGRMASQVDKGSGESVIERNGSSASQRYGGTTTAESCTDTILGQTPRETESQVPQRDAESGLTGMGLGVAPGDGVRNSANDGVEEQCGAAMTPTTRLQGSKGGSQDNEHAGGGRYATMLRELKISGISFARDLTSPAFLPLIPYFVFVLIDVLFFTPSAKALIPDAYAANQYITVCGFAPCIVLGYLADRIGIIYVMMICNGAGLLSWVLLLIPQIPCLTAFQYIVSILFTVQMCFLVSQIYCYVAKMFPPENLGKLIGVLCCTGGLISLVTSPMRDYSVKHTYYPMVVFCLVLAAVNEGLLGFMYYWEKRSKKIKQERAALQDRVNEEKLNV